MFFLSSTCTVIRSCKCVKQLIAVRIYTKVLKVEKETDNRHLSFYWLNTSNTGLWSADTDTSTCPGQNADRLLSTSSFML